MTKTIGLLIAGTMAFTATGASAASFGIGPLGISAAGQTLFADFDTVSPTPAAQRNSQILDRSIRNAGVTVDGSRYLSVRRDGFTTFDFNSSGISSFSFDASTIDPYNALTVTFLGGATQVFSGAGYTGPITTRAFITAGAGERIVAATFASADNSFEIDNIAVSGAVPEPATWAMMILGMGAIGASLRRRKANVAFV